MITEETGLFGCFGVKRSYETVFQSISARLPEKKMGENIFERTIWITVGQGPTALAVGAGGGCLDIFILIYPFSPLSPSLWETARDRLKYCLKGPLNPKQPTNQPTYSREKMFKQALSALTASAVGSSPTHPN